MPGGHTFQETHPQETLVQLLLRDIGHPEYLA
jgi:hypothetical protein